jgi:histidine triad (HIT) family protein
MISMPTSSQPSVFSRIIAREIPADVVFESDSLIAFRDINPQAPVHLLIVPKTERYRNVTELAADDPALLAEIVATAKQLANEHSAGEYRLVFNEGASAGQTVFHVHAHLLGGALAEGTLGQ